MCFDFIRQFNVNAKIVRIFNTYGPYLKRRWKSIVSNFIYQSLNNHNITIFGKGNQTRSFCYIDDLIDGILKTIKTSKKFHGPVNLGNPKRLVLINLQKLLSNLQEVNQS